nr:hypothetical protein [Tanacetum cinerariifolium]
MGRNQGQRGDGCGLQALTLCSRRREREVIKAQAGSTVQGFSRCGILE